MSKKNKNLSQDEMIKNLIRDYPEDSLEFFYPEIIKRYGTPTQIHFHIQERKKHSLFDPNLKNDIAVIYEFKNGEKILLTLVEHWSDKNQFDIYRFAHYVIDLAHQFPGYDILPVALFTDESKKWRKEPKKEIAVKCIDEVFLEFRYSLVRMKAYEAEHYKDTKNKFIAVLRSAMNWDAENKIILAVDFIKRYGYIENEVKLVAKNIDIIEYYLHINEDEKDTIVKLLEERGDTNMIVQEILKKGKIEGLKEGREQGKKEDKIETAKKMLSLKKFSMADIKEVTGLSIEEIEEIKKNMKH